MSVGRASANVDRVVESPIQMPYLSRKELENLLRSGQPDCGFYKSSWGADFLLNMTRDGVMVYIVEGAAIREGKNAKITLAQLPYNQERAVIKLLEHEVGESPP